MAKKLNFSQQFAKFAAEFGALCVAAGGVFNEADCIGNGRAYRIPTAFGTLRASIHFDDWKNRRADQHIECIYLSWHDYSGPEEFPLHGDFNPYSHKWNILVSAGTLEQARKLVLHELKIRLELLAEEFPLLEAKII